MKRQTEGAKAAPWSRQELAFLRKHYRNYETAWIAEQLGRTVYGVRHMAYELQVRKGPPSVWRGNRGRSDAFKKTIPKSRRSTRPKRTPLRRW